MYDVVTLTFVKGEKVKGKLEQNCDRKYTLLVTLLKEASVAFYIKI